MQRVDAPPKVCPTCRKANRVTEKREGSNLVEVRIVGSRWHSYKLIDTAPACGCGDCGHVVYLKKLNPFVCFYVDDAGQSEAA